MKKKIDDKEIVMLLLKHGKLTLPRLAKLLNEDVGSVDYHLTKLAEKGIVLVDKKIYGTKYYLNNDLLTLPNRRYFRFAFVVGFTVTGLLLLINFNFLQAALLLTIPSLTATIKEIKEIREAKTNLLKELLAKI